MSERLSVVIPSDLDEQLEELQEILHLDKSSLVRQLLYTSIREIRISHAIETYKQGKISFGKAAGLAGISIWEFIDELERRHVSSNFTIDDARNEIARWKKRRENDNQH